MKAATFASFAFLAAPPLLVVPFLAGCGSAAAQGVGPAAWTPPATRIPSATMDDVPFLQAHGLGDPRGGEYREAKVVLGDVWGEVQTTTIHGWVLPGAPARVVAPDGLVYDAVAVGPKADVAADVARPGLVRGFVRVPAWSPTPAAVGVLLLAGRTDLAERLADGLPTGADRGDPDAAFLSRLFDQAIVAHMRGDDAAALRVGRLLARVRPDFERRAAGARVRGSRARSLAFLDPVPALVEDAERRLRQGARPKLDLRKASVAALIDRLDEVGARQDGQPGGVDLAGSPLVAALVARGKPAVEPLLDAMENDVRLTRSVGFGRDFFPERTLFPVRSAAYAAFVQITDATALDVGGDGRIDVAALRRYWRANADRSPAERWFALLADDAAGERRWMAASARLHEGSNVRHRGAWVTDPKAKGPRNAEAVRGRRHPSLSDLLARRARELTDPRQDPNDGGFALADGLRLARRLAEWDPQAARPVLRETSRRAMAAAHRPNGDYVVREAGPALVAVLEARARLGDAQAWREYADWVVGLPEFRESNDLKILAPLARDQDPALRSAARRLLAGGGPMRGMLAELRNGELWPKTLLAIPEFRAETRRLLADRRRIGEAWVDNAGTIRASRGGTAWGQGKAPAGDPGRPTPGERRPYRVADAIAWSLRNLRGAPTFRAYWPVPQRDGAIRRLEALLAAERGRAPLVAAVEGWRDGDERR